MNLPPFNIMLTSVKNIKQIKKINQPTRSSLLTAMASASTSGTPAKKTPQTSRSQTHPLSSTRELPIHRTTLQKRQTDVAKTNKSLQRKPRRPLHSSLSNSQYTQLKVRLEKNDLLKKYNNLLHSRPLRKVKRPYLRETWATAYLHTTAEGAWRYMPRLPRTRRLSIGQKLQLKKMTKSTIANFRLSVKNRKRKAKKLGKAELRTAVFAWKVFASYTRSPRIVDVNALLRTKEEVLETQSPRFYNREIPVYAPKKAAPTRLAPPLPPVKVLDLTSKENPRFALPFLRYRKQLAKLMAAATYSSTFPSLRNLPKSKLSAEASDFLACTKAQKYSKTTMATLLMKNNLKTLGRRTFFTDAGNAAGSTAGSQKALTYMEAYLVHHAACLKFLEHEHTGKRLIPFTRIHTMSQHLLQKAWIERTEALRLLQFLSEDHSPAFLKKQMQCYKELCKMYEEELRQLQSDELYSRPLSTRLTIEQHRKRANDSLNNYHHKISFLACLAGAQSSDLDVIEAHLLSLVQAAQASPDCTTSVRVISKSDAHFKSLYALFIALRHNPTNKTICAELETLMLELYTAGKFTTAYRLGVRANFIEQTFTIYTLLGSCPDDAAPFTERTSTGMIREITVSYGSLEVARIQALHEFNCRTMMQKGLVSESPEWKLNAKQINDARTRFIVAVGHLSGVKHVDIVKTVPEDVRFWRGAKKTEVRSTAFDTHKPARMSTVLFVRPYTTYGRANPSYSPRSHITRLFSTSSKSQIFEGWKADTAKIKGGWDASTQVVITVSAPPYTNFVGGTSDFYWYWVPIFRKIENVAALDAAVLRLLEENEIHFTLWSKIEIYITPWGQTKILVDGGSRPSDLAPLTLPLPTEDLYREILINEDGTTSTSRNRATPKHHLFRRLLGEHIRDLTTRKSHTTLRVPFILTRQKSGSAKARGCQAAVKVLKFGGRVWRGVQQVFSPYGKGPNGGGRTRLYHTNAREKGKGPKDGSGTRSFHTQPREIDRSRVTFEELTLKLIELRWRRARVLTIYDSKDPWGSYNLSLQLEEEYKLVALMRAQLFPSKLTNNELERAHRDLVKQRGLLTAVYDELYWRTTVIASTIAWTNTRLTTHNLARARYELALNTFDCAHIVQELKKRKDFRVLPQITDVFADYVYLRKYTTMVDYFAVPYEIRDFVNADGTPATTKRGCEGELQTYVFPLLSEDWDPKTGFINIEYVNLPDPLAKGVNTNTGMRSYHTRSYGMPTRSYSTTTRNRTSSTQTRSTPTRARADSTQNRIFNERNSGIQRPRGSRFSLQGRKGPVRAPGQSRRVRGRVRRVLTSRFVRRRQRKLIVARAKIQRGRTHTIPVGSAYASWLEKNKNASDTVKKIRRKRAVTQLKRIRKLQLWRFRQNRKSTVKRLKAVKKVTARRALKLPRTYKVGRSIYEINVPADQVARGVDPLTGHSRHYNGKSPANRKFGVPTSSPINLTKAQEKVIGRPLQKASAKRTLRLRRKVTPSSVQKSTSAQMVLSTRMFPLPKISIQGSSNKRSKLTYRFPRLFLSGKVYKKKMKQLRQTNWRPPVKRSKRGYVLKQFHTPRRLKRRLSLRRKFVRVLTPVSHEVEKMQKAWAKDKSKTEIAAVRTRQPILGDRTRRCMLARARRRSVRLRPFKRTLKKARMRASQNEKALELRSSLAPSLLYRATKSRKYLLRRKPWYRYRAGMRRYRKGATRSKALQRSAMAKVNRRTVPSRLNRRRPRVKIRTVQQKAWRSKVNLYRNKARRARRTPRFALHIARVDSANSRMWVGNKRTLQSATVGSVEKVKLTTSLYTIDRSPNRRQRNLTAYNLNMTKAGANLLNARKRNVKLAVESIKENSLPYLMKAKALHRALIKKNSLRSGDTSSRAAVSLSLATKHLTRWASMRQARKLQQALTRTPPLLGSGNAHDLFAATSHFTHGERALALAGRVSPFKNLDASMWSKRAWKKVRYKKKNRLARRWFATRKANNTIAWSLRCRAKTRLSVARTLRPRIKRVISSSGTKERNKLSTVQTNRFLASRVWVRGSRLAQAYHGITRSARKQSNPFGKTESTFLRKKTKSTRKEASSALQKILLRAQNGIYSLQQIGGALSSNPALAHQSAKLKLRADNLELRRKGELLRRMRLRLPHSTVSQYERFNSQKMVHSHLPRKLALTVRGKRNTRLPRKNVWVADVSRRYGLEIPKKKTATTYRPLRWLRRYHPLTPKRKQIVLIDRVKESAKASETSLFKKHLRRNRRAIVASLETTFVRSHKAQQFAGRAPTFTSAQLKSIQTKMLARGKSFTMKELRWKLLRNTKRQLRESNITAKKSTAALAHRTTALKRSASRALVRQNSLKAKRISGSRNKIKALHYQRSARWMNRLNRKMIDKEINYRLKWRRWSMPRDAGHPIARHWTSHKEFRARLTKNENLTYKGLPEITYPDFGYVNIQSHRGSTLSLGYARYRRIYRVKSLNNRFLRTSNPGIPFASIHARLELNDKKYRTVATRRPRRATRRASYQFEVNPSRLLKRTKSTKLPVERSERELGAWEETYGKVATWKNNRWQELDEERDQTPYVVTPTEMVTLLPTLWSRVSEDIDVEDITNLKKVIHEEYVAWRASSIVTTLPGFDRKGWELHKAVQFFEHRLQYLLTGIVLAAPKYADKVFEVSALKTQHTARRTKKLDRAWTKRTLLPLQNALTGESEKMREKGNDLIYGKWLAGAKQYLKRSRTLHLPPERHVLDYEKAYLLGRERTRFPAGGRYPLSYDSTLFAFARRASSSRFRRVRPTRFQRVKLRLFFSRKMNSRVNRTTRRTRQQRRLAQKLNATSYLSPSWRELLEQRAIDLEDSTGALNNSILDVDIEAARANRFFPNAYGQPFNAIKRRFASTPLQLQFKQARRAKRAYSRLNRRQQQTARVAFLRVALRRRKTETPLVDLKKQIARRRTLREQIPPPWVLKKRAKRRVHRKLGAFSYQAFFQKKQKGFAWAVSVTGTRATRRTTRAPKKLKTLLFDELVYRTKKLGQTGVINQIDFKKNAAKKPVKKWRTFRLRRKFFPVHIPGNKKSRALKRKELKRQRANAKLRARGKHLLVGVRLPQHRTIEILSRSSSQRMKTLRLRSDQLKLSRQSAAYRSSRTIPTRKDYRTVPASLKSRTLPQGNRARARGHQSLVKSWNSRHADRRSGILKYNQQKQAVADKSEHTDTFNRRFLDQVAQLPSAAPLTFQQESKIILKSEETIRREQEANVALKEIRYKKTAQYVEGVTRLLPELINTLVAQRMNKKPLLFGEAKGLVSSAYWSIRIHLASSNFSNVRWHLRDTNFLTIRKLEDEMEKRSLEQDTQRANRLALRKRLQPASMIRAPSTDRGHQDWLRMFYPRKHALFLEDPEDYGDILVSSANVRRLVPHRNPDLWDTHLGYRTLERRKRQVLETKFTLSLHRFETALQSSRRVPLVDFTDYEIFKDLTGLVGSEERESFFARPADSFFARPYSTSAAQEHEMGGLSEKLLLQRFFRDQRFIETEERPVSRLTKVKARTSWRASIEASARTGAIIKFRSATRSFLDPRRLRIKSPRSRQFLLRMQKQKMKELHETNANLEKYKQLRLRLRENKFKETPAMTRTVRRTTFTGHTREPLDRAGAIIATIRAKVSSRRTTTHLTARTRDVVKNILKLSERHVLDTSEKDAKVKQDEYLFREKHYQSLLKPSLLNFTSSSRHAAEVKSSVEAEVLIVESDRTVLRRAKSRSPRTYYKASKIIPRGVQLRQAPARKLRSSRALKKRTKALQVSGYNIFDQVSHREGIRRVNLEAMAKNAGTKEYTRRSPRTRPSRRKLSLSRKTIKRSASTHAIVVQVDKTSTIRTGLFEQPKLWPRKVRPLKVREKKKIGALMLRKNTFDRYRTRLWDMLTTRKNKKFRYGRTWLKKVKRWFNLRWNPAQPKNPNNPLTPPVLPSAQWMPSDILNDIRRRFRKLEWRESDELFYHKGFRNAFSFAPIERRQTPWLEPLIYKRAIYSTRRGEYRRHQYPREQKRLSWLQRVRKMMYPSRRTRHLYIKGRRWPRLRMYNQRLFLSLYNLRNVSAARRHFRKLNRRRSVSNINLRGRDGFTKSLKGLGDRLDILLMTLKIAPSIFWARILAPMGLIRANGVRLTNAAQRLEKGCEIRIDKVRAGRFRHFFEPLIRWHEKKKRMRPRHIRTYPKNFVYNVMTRSLIYLGRPKENELRRGDRINGRLHRYFKLDSTKTC